MTGVLGSNAASDTSCEDLDKVADEGWEMEMERKAMGKQRERERESDEDDSMDPKMENKDQTKGLH